MPDTDRVTAGRLTLADAARNLLEVIPSSDDMRLLIRMVGGPMDVQENAIARFDSINDRADALRDLLSPHPDQ